MDSAFILFFSLALIAIVTAGGMIASRNAVYSALYLILNFATVALLYLILGAPFIALSQVTVYAGAIMVLFLFVIMLLGAEQLPGGEPLAWQRPLAIVLGLVLLAEGFYVIVLGGAGSSQPLPVPQLGFASPQAIGMLLFSGYFLPFEVTSVILLVAVVGAIVLTKPDRPTRNRLRGNRREPLAVRMAEDASRANVEQVAPQTTGVETNQKPG